MPVSAPSDVLLVRRSEAGESSPGSSESSTADLRLAVSVALDPRGTTQLLPLPL